MDEFLNINNYIWKTEREREMWQLWWTVNTIDFEIHLGDWWSTRLGVSWMGHGGAALVSYLFLSNTGPLLCFLAAMNQSSLSLRVLPA